MVSSSNPTPFHIYDVIVVGDGNAGLVAALSAQEAGARVALLECAPKVERGGNSRFASAIFCVVHNGRSNTEPLLCPPTKTKPDLVRCRIRPYTRVAYEADMLRTSKDQCDSADGSHVPTLV
jgi:tricarballylate dehydrogenase